MNESQFGRLGDPVTHKSLTGIMRSAPWVLSPRNNPHDPFGVANGGEFSEFYWPINSWPAIADCVEFCAVATDEMMLIVLAGSTPLQWPGYVSAYLSAPPAANNRSDPQNYILRAARYVYNQVIAWAPWRDRRIYVAGHSLGGAIAQAFAYYFRSQARRRVSGVFTYGAPRGGDYQYAAAYSGVTSVAMRTVGDPVVYIPPHATESPAVHYGLTRAASLRLNAYVNLPFGYQVSSGGVISQGEPVSQQEGGVSVSLLAWITGSNGLLADSHSIQTYYNAFAAAPLPSPPPTPPPTPNIPIGPLVQTATQRTATIAIGRAEVFAAADPSSPDYVPVVIPSRPPHPASRYKRRRVGSSWGIEIDGEYVATGLHKRQAGLMARRWNKAMRTTGRN